MTPASGFLWNIFLALTWAAATGTFTLGNLVLGFGLGYALLVFAQPIIGPSSYFAKARQAVGLAAYVGWTLVLASLRVAYDVVTPRHHARPGVIAVPLEAETDAQITVLANLISLTPGTLALDVSEDRRTLYIHAMFVDDPDALRRDIKRGLERRVLNLWA
jgi:multicomponent Na+:H+ antiporter subunit E